MANVWVYKEDGTLQCGMGEEISVATMRQSLASLIGDSEILGGEKRVLPLMRPALCGTPTGNVNAYEITEKGAFILFQGFVGPMGFKLWIWSADAKNPSAPEAHETKPSGGDLRPWPWSATTSDVPAEHRNSALLNFISSLTLVGNHPTTLMELIGHRVRYYKAGDPLTLDLIPSRVNIEHDDLGVVTRVWFG